MRRIGRGVLSHTTINAVLRSQRVPRWEPLQHVVAALDGDVERFRSLWIKARDAEEQTPTACDRPVAATAPLVGRVPETDLLRGRIVEVAGGRGGAMLIEGDPGIGKSFLMRAMSTYAETLGCRTLWASCDELSQAFPLLPLLDTVDGSVPVEERISPPAATVFQSDPAPADRMDLVAAATERMLAIIDELCASTPVTLVVDDVQWADATTMVALRRLVRMARRLPLLLVMAARRIPRRRDLGILRNALPPSGRIRLDGLSDPEVVEFVAGTAGLRPGPRLTTLARTAAGNPLYLTELMAALARGDALSTVDGYMEVTGDWAPRSLAAAIADRLEFLSKPAREVLRTTALLGAEFSVTDLMTVLGRGINQLLPMLDEAIDAGVLREDGPHLAFRHPLLRTALYEETPHAVRAAWHGDAAKALAGAGAPPERVARQLLPAGESDAADHWTAEWLAGSAHELIGRAPHAAIPLLRRAVARGPSGRPHHDLLCCRLADALRRTGDMAGAARVAREAAARTADPDLLVDLLWTFAETQVVAGHPEAAFVALDRALAGSAVEVRHRAQLMVIAARIRSGIGQVEIAGELAGKALDAATAAEDLPTTARALSALAAICGMRGDEAESLRLCERALAIAEGDATLADLRLTLQTNKAAALCNMDQWSEALDVAERVRESADLTSNVLRLGYARCLLVEILFNIGRWDDALVEADLVLDSQPDVESEAMVLGLVAMIRAHRDSDFDGRDLPDHDWRPYGGRVVVHVLLARGLAHERAGQPAEALRLLTQGLAESEEATVVADLLVDVARLAVTLDDQAAIRTMHHHVENLARRSAGLAFHTLAPHSIGLAARDPVQLSAAARRYAAAGRPLPQAQALEAAATALADGGDVAGARAHLDEAREIYAALGAEWDLARTAALLR
ncbi:ATP-binding protein [Phytohabitans sp. LJ34]